MRSRRILIVMIVMVATVLFLAATAVAQVSRQTQSSGTTENLRGASAVSEQVAWASGAHGTYLRTTDGGRTWLSGQVADASALDFRGVVAFSSDEAFLMSSGPGDQSRIYHTANGGQSWQLQLTASKPMSFFDAMAFWDRTHGVVLGDPVAESGKLKFEVLLTTDGQTWTPISAARMPEALEGEGAFAASNSCLAILASMLGAQQNEAHNSNLDIWFATGGKAARVFHSPDRGLTWEVFNTPITHGPGSAGIFSITFRDSLHGVIAGGDYKKPDQDGPNLAFTKDGGKTWALSPIFPQAYFSAVAYDRKALAGANSSLDDNEAGLRLFIVAPKFLFDFRPPKNPSRISPKKNSGIGFNAISAYPNGGALLVGPKGAIATIP
jgi:photosystem II stability/assembly factor-like uncharacterized protein